MQGYLSKMKHPNILCISLLFVLSAPAELEAQALSLKEAEQLATIEEPGYLSKIRFSEAYRQQAIALGELPDPKMSIALLNVPTDTFDLDQEPMNQLKFGLRQAIPRGDTLRIKKETALIEAEAMDSNAELRYLSVILQTRFAWIDLFYWLSVEKLVQDDKPLFEQLRGTTGAYYEVGRKDLQDVIRSELELQKLSDRLTFIADRIEASKADLSRWIGTEAANRPLSGALPNWPMPLQSKSTVKQLAQLILSHPDIERLQLGVDKAKKDVELTQQLYKPNWGVELGYSFRQADRAGSTVSDLLSAAVTFDLPLFRAKRQDKLVAAAQARQLAKQDVKLERIRKLAADLSGLTTTWWRLKEREDLHRNLILPQSKDQATTALLAYESDTSDFAEVMRARIADLEARIAYEKIVSNAAKTLARIRFIIPPTDDINQIPQIEFNKVGQTEGQTR